MANTKTCKRCLADKPLEDFRWTDKRHLHRRNVCPSCSRKAIRKAPNAKLAPIIKPSILDIAWAAGVWEGEGNCTAVNEQWFRVSTAQKDPYILHKLRDLFGGSVNKYECTSYKYPTHIHTWYLYGSRAHGFIQTIFTFLSPRRREQVKKAIQLSYGQ